MYFYFTPIALETPSQTGAAWGLQSETFSTARWGNRKATCLRSFSKSTTERRPQYRSPVCQWGVSLCPATLALSPDGSDGKESSCNAGDLGSIPGSGGSPVEENSNSLQSFCLENPMGRGAWHATVDGVTKNCTQLNY